MLIKIKREKRGLSLVEVVVSMAILALTIFPILSLMIGSLRLVKISRDNTEAVVLAQKGIAEFRRSLNSSCSLGEGEVPDPIVLSNQGSGADMNIEVSLEQTLASNEMSYNSVIKGRMQKVKSTVKGPSGNVLYTLTQVIPKEGGF